MPSLAHAGLVAGGAAIGAVLRWALGLALNSVLPGMPLGTLAANWLGGLAIGVVLGVLLSTTQPHALEWRLLLVTGLLGGLTTMSSFSAEVVMLLREARYAAAGLWAALQVGGSLLLTAAGFAAVQASR